MRLTKKEYEELTEFITNYPVSNEHGFTINEQRNVIDVLSNQYPNFNTDAYWAAQNNITSTIDNGNIITYHTDVLLSCVCAIESRKPTAYEFD